MVFICSFPVKCWLFESGLPNLVAVCIGLALLTGLSASLTAIIAALVASIAAHIVAWFMLCSATIFISI